MTNVATIFEIADASRREELVNMTIHDIEDKGMCLLLPYQTLGFRVWFGFKKQRRHKYVDIYRSYATLRHRDTPQYLYRFFLFYKGNKCNLWVQQLLENDI